MTYFIEALLLMFGSPDAGTQGWEVGSAGWEVGSVPAQPDDKVIHGCPDDKVIHGCTDEREW